MFDIERIRKLLCYIRNMSATLLRTLMLEITCSIHQEINFFSSISEFLPHSKDVYVSISSWGEITVLNLLFSCQDICIRHMLS